MRLLTNAPINALSFGNVSINILREFYKKGVELCFFPIGDKVQVEAYDKIDKKLLEFMHESTSNRFNTIDKEMASLKLWHINGSENRLTKNQSLFTFHETSELTATEKQLLKLQDHIFITSEYTKNIFEINGIENVHYCPLGFDPDFHKTDKEYLPDKINFGLMGKMEYRKNTARIIKNWLSLFGNDPRYQLSCAITNMFLDQNHFQNELIKITEGKPYNNLNFIPYMQTNSEVNDFINGIDIDLGGLSGGEGWNLPSFNATALGKWSVVLNATGHKGWATPENCILVEPTSLKDCYDNVFFKKGAHFNQGQFFDLTDEEMKEAIIKSLDYAKKPNPEGEKIRDNFTYQKTADTILDVVLA